MKKIAFDFTGMSSPARELAYDILYRELKKLGYEWNDPLSAPIDIHDFLFVYDDRTITYGDLCSDKSYNTIESFLLEVSRPKYSVGDYVYYKGFALPIKIIEDGKISLDTEFTGTILDTGKTKLNWHEEGWWIEPSEIKKATIDEIKSTVLAIAKKVYPKGTVYESINPGSEGIWTVKNELKLHSDERITDQSGGSVWHIKYGWAKIITSPECPVYKVGEVVVCIEPDEIAKTKLNKGSGYKLGRVFKIGTITEGAPGQQILFPEAFIGESYNGVYSNSVKIASLDEIRNYLEAYVTERKLTYFVSALSEDVTFVNGFNVNDNGVLSNGYYLYWQEGKRFSKTLFEDVPITLFGYPVERTSGNIKVGCKEFTYTEAKAIEKFFRSLKISGMSSEYFEFDKSEEDIPRMLKVINEL